MKLDEAQRKAVSAWIADGLKLSDIQNRLASELGIRLTYIEVRFLVDDLKLTPKDTEPPKPAALAVPAKAPAAKELPAAEPDAPEPAAPAPEETAAAAGKVSVTVDQIARPGAVVSGRVTFSDGNKATWQLDQMGRLGLATETPGYRPPAADVQQFQMALEAELSRLGM
jgi:hypothetical protein